MTPLTKPTTLLRKGLQIYLSPQYRLMLLAAGIVPATTSFIVSILGTWAGIQYSGSAFLVLVMVIFIIISLFVGLWWSTFMYLFFYAIANNEPVVINSTAYLAWKRLRRVVSTSVIFGGYVLLGLILLIIPGLMFLVWYYFAQAIAAVENTDVDPIKMSKQLVKGRFWPVAGRILLFLLLALIPGLLLQRISLYLKLAWDIFTPYFTLVLVLFYLDIRSKSSPR